MANVREMKPVGSTNIATVRQQLAGGHQAQGFALAQTVIAQTISTAQALRRAVETAFEYSIDARESCVKVLQDWRKEMTQNAKNNGNLDAAGVDSKTSGQMARSAATRVSEFITCITAMNNGFTKETLREKTGVADIENVSFHVIVALCRKFNSTNAQGGQGRPADPFEVKLAKWLARQDVTNEHDAEVKAKAVNALANILPVPEDAPDAETLKEQANKRRADDQ